MKEVRKKEIFQRNVNENEKMDFSCILVFTKEISEMNKNVSLEGSVNQYVGRLNLLV